MNGERRTGQIDAPAACFLDAAANFAFDLRGGEGKSLVRAACAYAEGVGLTVAEVVEDLAGDRIHIQGRAPGTSEIRHAENLRDPVADAVPVRTFGEGQLDPPHEHAHFTDTGVLRRRPQIARKPRDEPGTVVPLERDLLIVNYY